MKSLEAITSTHKNYHVIHNSLSPSNFIVSKSDDLELTMSVVGYGSQSIDLEENNCQDGDLLFKCFDPKSQAEVRGGRGERRRLK